MIVEYLELTTLRNSPVHAYVFRGNSARDWYIINPGQNPVDMERGLQEAFDCAREVTFYKLELTGTPDIKKAKLKNLLEILMGINDCMEVDQQDQPL